MLNIIQVSRRQDIFNYFLDNFNKQQTWIVSSLRNKLELQDCVLQRQEYFFDENILRLSDLWKWLLKLNRPEISLASTEAVQLLLSEFLQKQQDKLGLTNFSVPLILKILDQMAGIYAHPMGDIHMQEWFLQNPQSAESWQEWYLIGRMCYRYLSEQKKITSPHLCASHLLHRSHLMLPLNTELFVDLSSEISQHEAELLFEISKNLKVNVFVPHNQDFLSKYAYLLRPYDYLLANSANKPQILISQFKSSIPKKKEVHRLSTQLAELKWAIGKMKLWRKEGIDWSDMILIAPDIEQYWPALMFLSEYDQLPIKKNTTVNLASLPSLGQWLARLRLAAKKLNVGDLEFDLFGAQESQILDFVEFESLFSKVYEYADLARSKDVQKIYEQAKQMPLRSNAHEFIQSAILFWRTEFSEQHLAVVVREFLTQTPILQKDVDLQDSELGIHQWIDLLEKILSRKEINIETSLEGVSAISLMSAGSVTANYRIFLGLSEEQLRGSAIQIIQQSEVLNLAKDTGYLIQDPELSHFEFELNWLACDENSFDCYLFPQTNFFNDLQSPSGFWLNERMRLENNEHIDQLSIPESIAFDHYCANKIVDFVREYDFLGSRNSLELKRQSPSKIEDYKKCSFKWAAANLFHLRDLPELDLDIDGRTRGSLYHALFFEILSQHAPPNCSALKYDFTEIESILEKIKKSNNLIFARPQLWNLVKEKAHKTARSFLSFEKKWREQFYRSKPKWLEHAFTLNLLDLQISGRIDRVDTDENGHFIIIDYKSTIAGASNHTLWLQKFQLQMLFYVLALKSESLDVVAAHYFVFKNMQRDFGLQLKDFSGQLYPVSNKRSLNIDQESFETLLVNFRQLLLEIIEDMKSGKIIAQPLDPEICHNCKFPNLCRIPLTKRLEI